MAGRFQIVQCGPSTFLLGGELDIAAEPDVEAAVEVAVRDGGPILFDLAAVSFVDSTGIRAFLSVARSLAGIGCLTLHAPNESVRRILDIVGIADLRNVHVAACPDAGYPRQLEPWSPPPDLRERLEALRPDPGRAA
jgi:anti-anti-sigma factor